MPRTGGARGRAGRVVGVALATTALFALAVWGVIITLSGLTRSEEDSPRCAAALDGTSWYLSPAQAENAALFAAMALERELPARAVTIAIATGLQESRLVNLDYGDRDSLGLFQQRPSQGWGTPEEVMDPVYATGAFYDGLVRVPGYAELPVTEAAQAVQRSAFPDAYAQHETRARAWASGLTGHSPAVITCDLAQLDAGDAVDADELLVRLLRDFPSLAEHARVEDGAVVISPGGLAGVPAERAGWALAQWAVAVAGEHRVTAVAVAGQEWTRAPGTWQESATAPAEPGAVRISVGA